MFDSYEDVAIRVEEDACAANGSDIVAYAVVSSHVVEAFVRHSTRGRVFRSFEHAE